MLIVGERINSTRQKIAQAIASRDGDWILQEASRQIGAGADYIDINCAMTSGDEIEDIEWAVDLLGQKIKGVNICIDSPDHRAIERALAVYKAGGRVMINSITAEKSRIENILPLALKHKAKLVALTMSEQGMPNTAQERFAIAQKIHEAVSKSGFPGEDLYFDALIRPVSTEPDQAREFLRSLLMIKSLGARTICGLSNVSFGLPDRKLINAVFLSMASSAGLDAAILDPTDQLMASSVKASEAILGSDEYCAKYISAFREGTLI